LDSELRKLYFIDNRNLIEGNIKIFEQDPENEEKVLLIITIKNETFNVQEDNLFSALQVLRSILERKNVQIKCNGAAINVYPSPMQISMGSGRLAYKLTQGQQAKHSDIVDIFDCDEGLNFVSIEEQLKFYNEWSKTL